MPRKLTRKTNTKNTKMYKKRKYNKMLKSPGMKTHYFTRTLIIPGAIFSTSTASSFNSLTFSLNGAYLDASVGSANSGLAGNYTLPNSSEFTNLYEKFSIRKIVIKFYPRNDSTQEIGGAVNQSPQYWTIVNDYNDASPNFSQSDLLQMPRVRNISTLIPQKHVIVPAVQTTNYNSAVSSSYSQKFKPWLDTSTASATPHYACKIFFPSTVANASQKYDTFIKYYLAFRQPK
jgi:hypothetical protein